MKAYVCHTFHNDVVGCIHTLLSVRLVLNVGKPNSLPEFASDEGSQFSFETLSTLTAVTLGCDYTMESDNKLLRQSVTVRHRTLRVFCC